MVFNCFNLPCSSPPTRGSKKERIRGSSPVYKAFWNNSCLCCLQVGCSSSIHSQTSFTSQQRQVDPEETVRICSLALWDCGSGQNTTRSSLAFFSLWSRNKQRPTKTSKALQGKPMQQYCSLSIAFYLDSFQTLHVLSSIHFSKKSHVLSPESFAKNTMCLFSAKHPLTCLLQQNILS